VGIIGKRYLELLLKAMKVKTFKWVSVHKTASDGYVLELEEFPGLLLEGLGSIKRIPKAMRLSLFYGNSTEEHSVPMIDNYHSFNTVNLDIKFPIFRTLDEFIVIMETPLRGLVPLLHSGYDPALIPLIKERLEKGRRYYAK
jgi:hypothetical protein